MKKELHLFAGGGIVIVGFAIGCINWYLMRYLNFEMVRVDMLYMNYGILPLFIVSASMISYGVFILSKWLYNYRRIRTIETLGRDSIIIMSIHLYVMQVIRLFISHSVAIFIITFAVSIILSFVIKRYLPYIYKAPKGKTR